MKIQNFDYFANVSNNNNKPSTLKTQDFDIDFKVSKLNNAAIDKEVALGNSRSCSCKSCRCKSLAIFCFK